jgi:uncharacterized protein YacL
VQSSPDYTQQLNGIVSALNRRATPTWIIAVVSAMLGALLTVAVQLLIKRLEQRRAMDQMRRIVYGELGQVCSSLTAEFLNATNEPVTPEMQRKIEALAIRAALSFKGEKYMNDNLGIAIMLEEHPQLFSMYQNLHGLEKDQDPHSSRDGIIFLMKLYLRNRSMKPQYLKRYMHVFQGWEDVNAGGQRST